MVRASLAFAVPACGATPEEGGSRVGHEVSTPEGRRNLAWGVSPTMPGRENGVEAPKGRQKVTEQPPVAPSALRNQLGKLTAAALLRRRRASSSAGRPNRPRANAAGSGTTLPPPPL